MDFSKRNAFIQLVLYSCSIGTIWATSLPLGTRSRQLLLYPQSQNLAQNPQIQLQPFIQIPYASASDRIDINQRGPFLNSAQNPNDLFLLYPQNGPIPSGAQSPSFNEIYPNVQFNPALYPARPGGAGVQPEIEPDAVLISTSPNGQGGIIVQDSQQPNPNPDTGSGSGVLSGNYPAFIGSVINWFGYGENPEQQPDNNKQPGGQPIKNQSELAESSEETSGNTDKPITAGEQDVLAAADKTPDGFPAKPNKTPTHENPNLNKIPGLKPGQRFYILNGQPQFYSLPSGLGQPINPLNPIYQNNLLYYRNIQGLPSGQPQLFQQPNSRQQENPFLFPQPDAFPNARNLYVLKGGVPEGAQEFRLAQPQVFPVQAAGGNEKVTNPFGQVLLVRSQGQGEAGRQLGAPYVIRTQGSQGVRKSGPNPVGSENEEIKAGVGPSNVVKTDAAAADVAALEFARYIAQRQHQQRLRQESDKPTENNGSETKA